MCVDKGGRDPVVCLGFSSTPTTYRLASGRQVVNEISRPKEFSNSTQVLGVKRIEHQSLLPLHNLCEQIFILGRKIYRQELYIVLINMFILQVFSRWFGFPPSRKVVFFFLEQRSHRLSPPCWSNPVYTLLTVGMHARRKCVGIKFKYFCISLHIIRSEPYIFSRNRCEILTMTQYGDSGTL